MPSASTKSSQPPPQFNMADILQDPLKGAVSVMEKKLRNLEKRKGKLTVYTEKAKQGGTLNEDQRKAAENLILVENSLEVVKELLKHMTQMETEYAKLSKKEAKRLKQEQTTFGESKALEAVTGVVEVQALLGNMTEEVRPDFLAGTNGACLLSEEELGKLDEIYAIVNPAEELSGKLGEQVDKCSSNLKMLLDGKDKEAFEGATFLEVKGILDKVKESGYFDKDEPAVEDEEAAPEEVPGDEEEAVDVVEGEEVEAAPELEAESEEVQVEVEAGLEEAADVEALPDAEPEAPEAPLVNGGSGVDLPDVEGQDEEEAIDFLGDSEVVIQQEDIDEDSEEGAVLETMVIEPTPEAQIEDRQQQLLQHQEVQKQMQQAALNAGSPEFVPRHMQAPPVDDSSAWEETPAAPAVEDSQWSETNADAGWQSVESSHSTNQQGFGRGRGRGRGRGFGRGGGRGRGGRGGYERGEYRERGDYERRDYQDRGPRQDRGNQDGGYRGNRDGGYRGGNRDGGYRGGNRGNYRGGDRDGSRGGYRGGRGGPRDGSRGNYRGGNNSQPQ